MSKESIKANTNHGELYNNFKRFESFIRDCYNKLKQTKEFKKFKHKRCLDKMYKVLLELEQDDGEEEEAQVRIESL